MQIIPIAIKMQAQAGNVNAISYPCTNEYTYSSPTLCDEDGNEITYYYFSWFTRLIYVNIIQQMHALNKEKTLFFFPTLFFSHNIQE